MRGRRSAVVIVLAAAAALAPSAEARVTLGEQRVVVATRHASATIEREPFRISFAGADGRARLAEVPNTRPGPLVVPPLPDPEPLGLDNLDGPTLYAPLPFKVGASVDLQIPAAVWAGNMLAGIEAGTMHAARDVVAARRAGPAAELELSTSDPSGRRILLRVAPEGRRAIRVGARVTPSDGVYALGDSFTSAPGEAFRGFGGRHNALDQRGEDFYNWVEQQNIGAGPLEP
ncbi:MAG: hypothetical protein ACRDKX_06970, partial [Solirubrobacterales bacterium]